MKNNIHEIRIDEDELKIIWDELNRGCFNKYTCFETQKELFNAIYERVIKPHLQKHGDFERELRIDKKQLEGAVASASFTVFAKQPWIGEIDRIKQVLGEK